jgi:hypothetical protein
MIIRLEKTASKTAASIVLEMCRVVKQMVLVPVGVQTGGRETIVPKVSVPEQ